MDKKKFTVISFHTAAWEDAAKNDKGLFYVYVVGHNSVGFCFSATYLLTYRGSGEE